MNSSPSPPHTPTGVRVFINQTDVPGIRKGEPALFRLEDMELLEDLTAFLRAHYVDSGQRSSPRTWANAASAIATWVEFLDAIGVADWKVASRDDLIDYRESYASAISPKTGNIYTSGTIALRMTAICALYAFAGRKGWYSGDILDEVTGTKQLRVPLDRDALAHTRRGSRLVSASSDLIPRRRRSRTAIRPFTVEELHAFRNRLGPRASDKGDDPRASRDRLTADIGWSVGLRLHEIASLTKYQFLSLVPDRADRGTEHRMTITGKGNKVRSVAVPNWVVLDALAYIDGERAEAMKLAPKRQREPAQLIVSGLTSRRPGSALGQRRLQQIVEEACQSSGLVQIVEWTDPETGEITTKTRPKHCVHDLRHTYAVLTYWAEKAQGNSEPWKKIQAQLGHEHLQTTVDTYLHFVEIFGEREGIDMRRMLGL